MIVDITNELITELDQLLVDIPVLSSYPEVQVEFPCVVVGELLNEADIETKDSSGFKYSTVSIQVDIFTRGMDRITQSKTLRGTIDGLLSDSHGMGRTYARETPNFLDSSIYRYTLRYNCRLDANRKIYRG